MKVTRLAALAVVSFALLAAGGALHASNMDERIESSAKQSYVFKTHLKGDEIKVHSENGVVTLTGTVSELSHKSLAEETVAALPGVKKVDNRLVVKGVLPAKYSDAWVLAEVKAALLFHKNVSALHTKVDVKGGVVTLRGEASNDAQKELTTEDIKDIDGVKDVRNEMVVSGSSKKATETLGDMIDDASITAQVESALLLHRSTSALRTEVKTEGGVVTVQGKARNAAERDLVTKLVSDIKGVKSVTNKMIIAGSG